MRTVLLICLLGLALSLHMAPFHAEFGMSSEQRQQWDHQQSGCNSDCANAAQEVTGQQDACSGLDPEQCEAAKAIFHGIIESSCHEYCSSLIQAGIDSFAACAAEKCQARDEECSDTACKDVVRDALEAKSQELDAQMSSRFSN